MNSVKGFLSSLYTCTCTCGDVRVSSSSSSTVKRGRTRSSGRYFDRISHDRKSLRIIQQSSQVFFQVVFSSAFFESWRNSFKFFKSKLKSIFLFFFFFFFFFFFLKNVRAEDEYPTLLYSANPEIVLGFDFTFSLAN